MNWLHYLLEANLYLAVFYAGYYLFLSRETYYILNRIYLLFSCVASFALPVMQLGALKPVEQPITAVHFSFGTPTVQLVPVHAAVAAPVFTWQDGVVYVYLLGVAVLMLVLLIKLYQLYKLTCVRNIGSDEDYKVVYINQSDTAFSFFNYLFIGTKVQQADMIIKHELVHIRQKHSVDIIFIELLKIVNWFNPFIYLLQYSLREIHEFIADEQTATSGTDALTYSSFLVNNAYGLGGSSITHSFFNYNLLKKRIIMLHQKRSGSLARLRYLLAIPICGALLCASTLAFSKTYGWVEIGPHRDTDKTTSPIKLHELQTPVTVHELPPPPPHAAPVKRVKFPLPNPMMQHTAKGYYYSEAGYVENGKQDIVVTFKEKDGSHKEFTKSKATPAELALLKEKYGYVFPTHLRVPPPPPAPPKVSIDKRPPPPPPAPPKVTASRKLPPPPPPFEDIYKDFFYYLQKNTIYPTQASSNGLAGVVIAQYTLDGNRHIINTEIVKSDINAFNAEVMRAMKSYTGEINNASGEYCVVFRFCIAGETDNNAVRDDDAKLLQTTPHYTGEITIVGHR